MRKIEGVKIKELTVHQDIPDTDQNKTHLGFLIEILRDDDDLLKRFGQTTFTVTYEDTVKAFHWHKRQDDLWFVASGKAIIVLHDIRENSPTMGVTQMISAGDNDYKLILIPSGVAHGYKVIGKKPVLLFYHTTRSYDPLNPDEERIPWDDPEINFDWDAV